MSNSFQDLPEGRFDEHRKNEKSGMSGGLENLIPFIEALPYHVLVLNENRQIIHTNKEVLSFLNLDELYDILGDRPGEALSCIHANACETGCGTTDYCKYCGALNAILESKKENDTVKRECRIISQKNNRIIYYNFEVTAAPLILDNQKYTIFSLQDISEKNRKKQLERIFFHDILNTAGNISNISDLLAETSDKDQLNQFLKIIQQASKQLIDEIESQKQLSEAESGDLQPNFLELNTLDILKNLVDQFNSMLPEGLNLLVDDSSENKIFVSDRSMTQRIIGNMIKNAIEASRQGGTIILKSESAKSGIVFSVLNPGSIPEDIQKQIFQKTFSTKGTTRGFGTYSMKLLAENYLNGKVYFRTTAGPETIFFLELPVRQQ